VIRRKVVETVPESAARVADRWNRTSAASAVLEIQEL
jgi:hypothetical protein